MRDNKKIDSKEKTILDILEIRISENPDQVFLRTSHEDCSFINFQRRIYGCILKFNQIGIQKNDIVATILPNSMDAVTVWFSAMHIGAIWAPINTHFKGDQLANVINLLGSTDLVIESRYIQSVIDIASKVPELRRLHVVNTKTEIYKTKFDIIQFELSSTTEPQSRAKVSLDTVAIIQFTSGSTGVSKAVQLSHHYLLGQSAIITRELGFLASDTLFCPFPLHHWDATVGTVLASLQCGGRAALSERFSVSKFWDEIRRFDATVFDFMGATLAFLMSERSSPKDHDHNVRLAWGAPMPPFKKEFEKRFGLSLIEGYGSTEGGVMVYQRPGKSYPDKSCGNPVPEYMLRIVDNKYRPIQTGSIGEIIVKPKTHQNLITSGYFKRPKETTKNIRNGWYHTGDLGRLDEKGNLYYEGRIKDVIRRRGENISAFEIEQTLGQHSAIKEIIAYGVPSPYTEEDVAVAITKEHGVSLNANEVREYCSDRMARYMIPKYILFLDELQQTSTGKPSKKEIRDLHLSTIERLEI